MNRRVGYGQDFRETPMSQQGSPWDAYLTRDERILWEGHPAPNAQLPSKSWFEQLHGMAFLGFAIFWTISASAAGGTFALFGLPFMAVGAYLVFGKELMKKRRLQRTVYAVSTKNLFIATSDRGRKLKTYPITADMMVELIDSDPPSVIFGKERSDWTVNNRRQSHKVGFMGIADGHKVFRLIREVQEQRP